MNTIEKTNRNATNKPTPIMCDSCGRRKATRYDFRERYGVISKYRVCEYCFGVIDEIFFMQRDGDDEMSDIDKANLM